MRGDLDMVEDVRVKKSNETFNKHLSKGLIIFLIFILFCGLFFNATYLLSTKTVNKIDEKLEKLDKNKKDDSRKTYYIEQKLRRDLEQMEKNKK